MKTDGHFYHKNDWKWFLHTSCKNGDFPGGFIEVNGGCFQQTMFDCRVCATTARVAPRKLDEHGDFS